MKRIFLKTMAVFFALGGGCFLTACQDQKKFKIEGNISEAADSMLYFEQMTLEGGVCLDSVKLDGQGAFSFDGKAPGAPEFYRLRIAGKAINLSVDSTETIRVKAAFPTMSREYEVEGSPACRSMKELAVMQLNLQQHLVEIQQSPQLNMAAVRDSINKVIQAYKEKVKREYIYKDPKSPSSYYALFQTLGNTLIFNPKADKNDIKAFAAVATSWDTYHPGSVRGENLHAIAIEGMKNVRIIESRQHLEIDADKFVELGFIDVELPDNKGIMRSLKDLKGKVVMLDFHLFGTEKSTQRIMLLRELYNKYHAMGFEVYQVALDENEHFWKTKTAALPWVCVRDPQGAQSQNLLNYNVVALPTYFLIDKNGVLQKRDTQIEDLDAMVKSML